MAKNKNAQPKETVELKTEYVPVVKDLAYTKAFYEAMVVKTYPLIDVLKKDDAPKDDVTAIYSLYYESLAGLIRAGALCSRATGIDGFPEIRVVSGNSIYPCREDVLTRIFGMVAPDIIKPYEDSFSPYIPLKDPVGIDEKDIIGPSKQEEKEESLKIKQLKNSHKKELSGLRKKHDAELKEKDGSIEKLKHELFVANKELTALKNAPVPAVEPVNPPEQIQVSPIQAEENIALEAPIDTSEDMKAMQLKIQELESALSRSEQQVESLNMKNSELISKAEKAVSDHNAQVSKFKTLITRQKQQIDEHNKYVYDPNYDHYYSAELPKILDSIDFTRTDLGARAAGVVLCTAGIIISLLFII